MSAGPKLGSGGGEFEFSGENYTWLKAEKSQI